MPTSTKKLLRRYPPYGRQLEKIRRTGRAPVKRIIVTTDWNIGKVFPRIVITDELPASSFKFEYLAGLHVQIVFYDKDSKILTELIEEVLKINPASLTTFNMSAVELEEPASSIVFMEGLA